MVCSPARPSTVTRLTLAAAGLVLLASCTSGDPTARGEDAPANSTAPSTTTEPRGDGEPITITGDDGIWVDLDGWSESAAGEAEARGDVQRAGLGGYALAYPGLGLNDRYTVQMVDDHPAWTEIDEEVAAAMAELEYITGVDLVMGPNTATQTSTFGNITVQVATTSPCGPLSNPGTVGCGAGTSTIGRTVFGNIWICDCIADSPDAYSTVVHEFGHVAGLAHFEDEYEGQPQVMYPFNLPGMNRLRSGDVNGLRKVTANGFGGGTAPTHPPGAPSAPQLTGSFGAVRASWSAAAAYGRAIDRHEIQIEATGSGSVKTDSFGAARHGSVPVTGGATYRARVRAHNGHGWGEWSPWSSPVAVEGRCLPTITDIPESSDFCGDITWLLREDIAFGFPDDTFRPGARVTRQAMAAFLMADAERLAPGSTSGNWSATSFTDVPPDHPFHDQIEWLASTGITTGFPDGTFKPGNNVNRASMAAMLRRFTEHLEPGSTDGNWSASPFRDVPPDKPFHDEITWLDATGIASGFADGTFHPDESITRQALAAFLHRHDDANG